MIISKNYKSAFSIADRKCRQYIRFATASLLLLLGCFVTSVHAVFFIDNFENGVVVDSDSHTDIYTKINDGGSVVSENNHVLKMTFDGADVGDTEIRSAVSPEFKFINENGNDGVFYGLQGIKMTGSIGALKKFVRLEVNSSANGFDASNDGIRIEIRGDGQVQAFLRRNGSNVSTQTIATQNVVPFAIWLYMTKTQYKLTVHYDKNNRQQTNNIKKNHQFTASNWNGTNENASVCIVASKTGTGGTYTASFTEFFAKDNIGSNKKPFHNFASKNYRPPAIPAGNPLFAKGFLDVTLPGYGATPGGGDDTVALKKAIIDAYEYNLVCYFPTGEYHISDTLRLMTKTHLKEILYNTTASKAKTSSLAVNRRMTHCLVGQKGATRPKITLLNNSNGFNNTNNPKPMFHTWAQGNLFSKPIFSDDPKDGIPGDLFNVVFRGIDLDLGTGNAGAVGFMGAGAQGCTYEDSTINARNGYAGLYGLFGVGGGNYNIKIIGGKYGIYVLEDNEGAQFPQIAGLTLENQNTNAIMYQSKSPLTIAGFTILADQSPAINMTERNPYHIGGGNLNLIDGIIEMANNNMEAINNVTGGGGSGSRSEGIYMKNVYFRRASKILDLPSGVSGVSDRSGNGTGWARVKEFAYNEIDDKNGNSKNESQSIVNGVVSGTARHIAVNSYEGGVAPPADIMTWHIWDETAFPAFDDPDVVNVKDFGAVGNASADDYNAIVAAMAASDKVFFPKGIYAIRQTLLPEKDIKLFGAAKHSCQIRAKSGWAATTPLIKTKNSANGTTILAHLGLGFSSSTKNALFHWRTGEASMSRDLHGMLHGSSTNQTLDFQFMKWTHNAGGRHWGNVIENTQAANLSFHQNYREFLVDGTSEQLMIYSMNPEQQDSEPQAEVRFASNVFIFGVKGENGNIGETTLTTILGIKNSNNVGIFGYGGNARAPNPNRQIIRMENCQDSVMSMIGNLDKSGTNWDSTVKVINGGTAKIPFPRLVSYVRKGTSPSPRKPAGAGAPVLTPIDDVTLEENSSTTVNLSAIDPQSDPITLTSNNLPSFCVLTDNSDGTGTIQIDPNIGDAGSYAINVTASDNNGGSDIESFTLTVEEPNVAPVINPIGDIDVNEDGFGQINIVATDANGDLITLGATGLPAFGTFTDNGDGTGTIAFSPGFSDSGSYPITVTANDGRGGNDTEPFTLNVIQVNLPPTLTPISNALVEETQSIVISIASSDPDLDVITLSTTGVPSFGSLLDNGDGSGTLTFNPNTGDVGEYPITITADDGNLGTDNDTFILTVNNGNAQPSIASIPNQTVSEHCEIAVNVTATDADPGDTLTLSATILPSFGTFIDRGNRTGVIILTPTPNDVGVYTITVEVNDGNPALHTDNESFELTVNSVGGIAYRNNFSSGIPADDFTDSINSFTIANGELSANTIDEWKGLNLKTDYFSSTANNFKIVTKMKRGTGNGWNGAAIRFRNIDNDNWHDLQIRTDVDEDVRLFGKVAGATLTLGSWNTDIDASAYNTFSLVVSRSNADLYLENNLLGSVTTNHLTGTLSLKQRSNDAAWDHFRVVSIGTPDYAQSFDAPIVQDWVYNQSEFETANVGGGVNALRQLSGAYKYALYNQVVSVDTHYRMSAVGRVVGSRTSGFESPQFVVKYKDSANWIIIYIDQNISSGNRNLRLKKKIGGTSTEYNLTTGITSLVTVEDWHQVEVQVISDTLNVWINGTQEITDQLELGLNNPVFDATTQCGLRSSTANVSVEFDEFQFYDEYQ